MGEVVDNVSFGVAVEKLRSRNVQAVELQKLTLSPPDVITNPSKCVLCALPSHIPSRSGV